jgi:hypothetical protein
MPEVGDFCESCLAMTGTTLDYRCASCGESKPNEQMRAFATKAFRLDHLPGHCTLSTDTSRYPDEVRFKGIKADGTESEWSGWFKMSDAPIMLTWAAFWPTGEQEPR